MILILDDMDSETNLSQKKKQTNYSDNQDLAD